ncbi:hypothetical protein [Sphingomonas sp.]|uniref:hypothetical protein n=1 Tax=Sphingomonas sp. TaxID=28214 RepID=UPI00307F5888
MSTYRVIFEASVPDWILDRAEAETEPRTRSWLLSQSWYDRRRIEWHGRVTLAPPHDQSPTRHAVRLDLDCPRTMRPRCGSLTLAVDVAIRQGEDPLGKARRVLDLPVRAVSAPHATLSPEPLDRGSFCRVRGQSVIGPMTPEWPIDRTLTAYSHNLGSYGQGGVGLSGWQCNGGSWIVLPLRGSDGWIWLTREEIAPAPDFYSLNADIDQRIIGVHPDQLADFPPWEHRYAGHAQILDLPDFVVERATIARFDATASGFVLEAANGLIRWRFAMDDHLPRPIWAGSREPRDLYEGESVADAFLLTHDCYLEV